MAHVDPILTNLVPLELPAIVPPPVLREETPAVPQAMVWGLPLAKVTFAEAVELVERLIERGRASFFITANLHYAMLCQRAPGLAAINARAAFLLADGMPLVWHSRLFGKGIPERVTGADLVYALCQRAAERGYRVFLLGADPGVARRAGRTLAARYPGLKVVGSHSPPHRPLSEEEQQALVRRIRQAHPHLLFVALGQPKGELWLDEHCQALGVPACVQVGASFNFVAGLARRAPRWMQRTGLEWAYRLLHEPRRLGPRYFRNALFLTRAVVHDVFELLARRMGRTGGER